MLARSSSWVLAEAGASGNEEISVWISYENKTGKEKQTTILRMLPNETIADVKLKVQARKGWFASQQRLTFGDTELEDSKTIELVAQAAGIDKEDAANFSINSEGSSSKNSSHIHLVVHLSDILNVRIRTLQGESVLSAEPGSTVRELKEAVNLINGYIPDHQHIFHNGKLLKDNDKPLATVDSSESAIVHVLVKRTTKVKIIPAAGGEFNIQISAAETGDMLLRRIEAIEGIPAKDHRLLYNGRYISNTSPLIDYGVDEDSTLILEPVPQCYEDIAKNMEGLNSSLERCLNMFKQAQAGFDLHMSPCLASAGTGGAYFLHGPSGNKVAVFKPEDEEPNALNNPRGLTSPRQNAEGLRRGTLPGEGASREFAAFLLDHRNFANVPVTTMVCLKQTSNEKYARVDWQANQGKRGSLQIFVPSESDCEETGVSQFKASEVHKIALLDIRLANTDRNGSNVLVQHHQDSGAILIPIDHGYCLPGSFTDINFEWIYWPQAREPFSDEILEYIKELDVDNDLEVLDRNNIKLRLECKLVFKICNQLLKMSLKHNLTAYDIGNIMCRQTMQQSVLERVSHRALKAIAIQMEGKLQGVRTLRLSELGSNTQTLYLEKMGQLLEEYFIENSK